MVDDQSIAVTHCCDTVRPVCGYGLELGDAIAFTLK